MKTQLKIIINYIERFEEEVNEFCKDKKIVSIQIRKGQDTQEEQGAHFAYIVYEFISLQKEK